MPDAPMNEIKRIAMIDFGHKRKNFKYRVKKGINIQANDTRESIIESTPNITEFDAEDMEIAIDTWLTPEDKARAERNRQISKSVNKIFHTSGSKSYARVAKELGSILRAEDDALARAMGRTEYSGRVRGMGIGPLPVRPTSRLSASRLTQEAAFKSQMDEMMKKWEEEKRISDERWEEERRRTEEERRRADEERRRADEERKQTNERIAKQDQMMEKNADDD
ncbi:eukaryotic translation initiation factor 5B-like [Alnus glutinosa]|uniref:eukaryotic translation initiation factor 5B-like n=1 Tax=Alnus glutinosa TaxID=3517 RepID=UPI002D7A1378|nr:eukaryotic translation initiation factor 5B-like [Alnus glutinosa]